MAKQLYSTGTTWEPIIGYSRAVKVGSHIHVSGTAASGPDGKLVGIGDAGAQTRQTLATIGAALNALGASFDDVVQTRMYLTDITRDWEAVGRVHGEIFGDIRPATVMVEVSKLISPDMLIEIEAEAYLEDKG